MPLRIIDLINMPELHTRAVGGERGLERLVRWAHVCELPDPTEWLGDCDLLMTTGIGIPVAGMQAAYIEKLVKAGLAGVMIGEDMQAPTDLSALQAKADELDFPVLLTRYGVPFSSVTRAIIDAGRKEEFERRNAINRIFLSARMALEGLSLEELLLRLGRDIEAELMLLDARDHEWFWFPRNMKVPDTIRDAMKAYPGEGQQTQPVVRRYILDDGDVYAIAIPSRKDSILFVRNGKGHLIEYSLLHHLVAVLGLSIERLHVETERALRIGSQLLDDLLNLRLTSFEMGRQLDQFQLSITSSCLAVARPPSHELAEWHLSFHKIDVPAILRPEGDELIILTDAKHIFALEEVLYTRIGVSNVIGSFERLPEAQREARLALVHARECSAMAYANIADKVPWLPNNLDEAFQTFHRILGPLHEYDEKQGSTLLYSLKVFLEQNRSWLLAAKQLHIHKTTLIYRMRKIEALTGRSLDRTEDVAILWLALQAGEIAGLFSSGAAKARQVQPTSKVNK